MEASCSKRAVREISGPKEKPLTVVKDTAVSHDETGQLCSRVGCCDRLNHDTKGMKYKHTENLKPSKPCMGSSSSKNFKCGSSKSVSKCLKNSEKKVCYKTESSSAPSGIKIQEFSESGSHATSKSNNGRRKRLKGKGKKVIGVSTDEARVSVPKNISNVKSSKANGVSSVKSRKSLNVETSKQSTNQQSSSVVTNMSRTQELSLNGDHSTSDTSTDHAGVGSVNNIDGIADILLALDRYQHGEELTYEQLLSLEANLFLGGLNFYDQHRDMRLNIDNMSYEELLVLEEKMGTVSTALSEGELSKCIKTSVYESLQLENGKTRRSLCADDSKCSICLEDYVRGDEIGRLECGHGYHTRCINEWLGLKNWCPVCKATQTPA